MKISKSDNYFNFQEVHPNDFFLMNFVLTTFFKILNKTSLDTTYDVQEKKFLGEKIQEIILQMNEHMGTKTAESKEETLIRKVLSKYNLVD